MERRFEEIEHTADVAIRVWGRDLAGLFANAAYGMADQLAEPADDQPGVQRTVELGADDVETLLVTWLGELLYLGERDDCVFTDIDVREITPRSLKATVRGSPVREHRRHIKAVTFSALEVRATREGHETTIVFDV